MKDATLNQQEQARLQVLNSVMEYQLPRAQAAELLGISERHLRRALAAYAGMEPPHWSTATGAANPGTRFPRESLPQWSSWPATSTLASTTVT